MELSTRRHYGHATRTEGAAEADVRCRRDRGRARKLAGAYLPFPHPSFCLAVLRCSSLVVMEGNGDSGRGAQDQGKHLGAQHGARRRPYVANTRRIATSTPSPTAAAAPRSILRALRRREHHHHHHRWRAVLVAGLARPSERDRWRRRQPAPHRARYRALCDVVNITITTTVGEQPSSPGLLDLPNSVGGVANKLRHTALRSTLRSLQHWTPPALTAPSACLPAAILHDRPCHCRPRARYAGVTRFYIVAASAVLRRLSHLQSIKFLQPCRPNLAGPSASPSVPPSRPRDHPGSAP
jgi:hypothetical protein